jgi:transposase-like protein
VGTKKACGGLRSWSESRRRCRGFGKKRNGYGRSASGWPKISRGGGIFAAPAKEQALQIASSVANKWRRGKGNEKVAEHVEEHIEECLTCLVFPESHIRRIRTTNGLEHLRARR